MSALTRRELDNTGCGVEGCFHIGHEDLFLHGRCHPSAGTRASYNRRTGVLSIACRKCRAPIASLAIADGRG